MDSEYDRKFEEMKKYIPFLENMITRLENTSKAAVNPRQAQLDKIRSLRDLLLDKKKRMKMENLLKCEQVLINLYAKVEVQRDTLPGIQPASEVISPKEKTDLNLARNKLKNVTSKTHDPDTLPEIARASEAEVICSPGSKEPALFQRRPNKSSLSPTKNSSKDRSPPKSSSKRNYTRVLMSPERNRRLWSPSDGHNNEKHLYSRRSPPIQSRRYSPSYHKRERKKSSKQESHTRKSKDLNITLNVPEERLSSLNTKDILTRILNCSDGDVDIATLRELRTQIIGELSQTGAKEDISDLILKSYRNKKKKKTKPKDKADVEEGELSDSESEAIESIYGNLVVMEKDKSKDSPSNQDKSTEQDQVSRKIQICLVINSDKDETSPALSKNKNVPDVQKICDVSDFEMFDDNICGNSSKSVPSANNEEVIDKEACRKSNASMSPVKIVDTHSKDIISIEDAEGEKGENDDKNYGSGVIDMNNFDLQDNSHTPTPVPAPKSVSEALPVPFKVNFYKPISSDADAEIIDSLGNEPILHNPVDQCISNDETLNKSSDSKEPLHKSATNVQGSKDKSLDLAETHKESTVSSNKDIGTTNTPNSSSEVVTKKEAEIPLLNEPTERAAKKDIVSEIDILQALKKEILSDTISIPCAEVVTPTLHQPKITKVSNAQELPKKRISIENYKRKSIPSSKPSLFVKHRDIVSSKKESMKQSLKLTEKEVERFNVISKIALSDSSDDEKDTGLKSPDIDLAPMSPDMDMTDNSPVSPPVIIPADPVKMVVSSKADIDMRKLPMASLSPNTMSPFAPTAPVPVVNGVNSDIRKSVDDKPELKRVTLPADPRVRKEPLLPTPLIAYPNMTPSRNPTVTPNMTPSRAPNMTPNARSFEVTPSRPFDTDDRSRKHVYAPMFQVQDATENKSVWEPPERSPLDTNWEKPNVDGSSNRWEDRNSKNNFPQREEGSRSRYNDSSYDVGYSRTRNDRNGRDSRQEGPHTPNYYSRSDCPTTPTPSFGRGDVPSTPSHYFGRPECPRTPSHPFGRSESSNQSFVMLEPPLTPNHSFGQSEAPMTPSHPFGRAEAPLTPKHPFGRSEPPLTPSHPFGRTDYSHTNSGKKHGKPQDPRLNRGYDHDSNSRRDFGSYNDRQRYYRNDPRNLNRDQSVPRNDPKPYTPDQTYNRERDQMSCREPSVGRSFPRDNRDRDQMSRREPGLGRSLPRDNRDIEQMSRRESSVGQSLPRESDRESLYSRDRSYGPDNSRSYTEVGSRRSFQREPSANRPLPDYRARASSVGRSIRKDTGNELSIQSHAGRAFTIDTSVNSTFQRFLDSHRSKDTNFDGRRQRASSVGRSLTREPSVGGTQPSNNLSHKVGSNNSRFRRAQSVGRDLSTSSRAERSFKDLKAEFESYKYNDRKYNKDQTMLTRPKESTSSRDPRVRRESYDKQQVTNHSSNKTHVRESNTTTKKINYRDPRQRKEHKLNERDNRNRSDTRDRHSYGISSDSVTKSPVISSVKNYKIPKIKRAPEEKSVEAVVETSTDKIEPKKSSAKTTVKDVKQKSIEPQIKSDKKVKHGKKVISDKISNKKVDKEEKNKSMSEEVAVQNSEKRVTRQSGKKNDETQSSTQSDDDEIVHTRTRKFKQVIYDSDSDESPKIEHKSKIVSPKKSPAKKAQSKSIVSDQKEEKPVDTESNVAEEICDKVLEPEDSQEALDSSFGLDDLELFPDNITGPVLDNINALIADLDKDLATPKTGSNCDDLSNEISIENMLEIITASPEKIETKKPIEENDKTDTDTVKKNLFDTLIKESEVGETEINKPVADTGDNKKDDISNKALDTRVTDFIEEKTDLLNDSQSEIISQTDDANDREPVVSTSVNQEESSMKNRSIDREKNVDAHLTPDSTDDAGIAVEHISETTGPDSTIEKQCEMNSDISSTHDTGNKSVKYNSDITNEPALHESLGSFLSILKDKTKIKELLNIIGEHSSDNEKIKKKLEKLSEIVSDDEETMGDKIQEETTKIDTSSKDEVSVGFVKQFPEDQKDPPPQVSTEHEVDMLKENKTQLEKPTESEPRNSSVLTATETKENVENENEKEPVAREETADLKTVQDEPKIQVETENKEDAVPSGESKNSTKTDEELGHQEDAIDFNNDAISEPDDVKKADIGKLDSAKVIKRPMKKTSKGLKTGKFKKGKGVKQVISEGKRVTRSKAAGLLTKPKHKTASRELKQLQESIKEMFMSDDILNASGIRMCRLAKMVDDKTTNKDDGPANDPEPVVVLEKVKHLEEREFSIERTMRKKPGLKPKANTSLTSIDETSVEEQKLPVKYKPGPKSKRKIAQVEKDPYDFETDSINETKSSEKAVDNSSDSESESLASSKSFGSSELLVEVKKKPKRKRGGWKTGVIKPKNKKRKIEVRHAESPPRKPTPEPERKYTIPDFNCFTDKNYCFSKNATEYSCRLCDSTHSSTDIVFHYKKHHPHSEIPLSRMSPNIAREAIEQCGDIDFRAISKIPTERYTCRFCFKEFAKKRAVLEAFFWHVVSMHTGEYKQLCSECINITRCPFNLDIPPPPKDVKGQLIGYICGKCNFTQLSLENLKTHVIVRHNDKETEVYTINFAVMTKKTINNLVKRCSLENKPRSSRTTRSNQSYTEASDDRSEVTESESEAANSDKKSEVSVPIKTPNFSIKSKITFENDDNVSDMSNVANTESSSLKVERDDVDQEESQSNDEPFIDHPAAAEEAELDQTVGRSQVVSDDIMDYPHFKITYTDTGSKEYVCCINGNDNHYKTGLLISMKKHVQLKHSEIWDGYCFVCKVIVTSQGQHKFSECLMHFLDKHIDNFPVFEKANEPAENPVTPVLPPEPPERAATPKGYINVRPLTELVKPVEPLPVIENVISLVPPTVEPPRPSPTYPVTKKEIEPPKEYKYEEAQAEVMSKKHRVVLDAMMSPDKLVQIFKCAGRFCSFTSDSLDDALQHASTHQRIGGTNALLCAYCDFDSENPIDLVLHVFKSHGRCQFVCSLCFYRAAASQLVGSHIARVHGKTSGQDSVLKSTSTPAVTDVEENMTRENAVPLYICKQSESEEPCTFRTVTHTKFWEHMMNKHAKAAGFNCYICSTVCSDATALVLHLKTHGLKLYHCTLCVYGADNEPELLAHASAKHPAKPPQAYIRTICGQSGNGSFKILPLVDLKKNAQPSKEVVPSKAKENPTREAERSIDLEKLIGHVLDAPVQPTEPAPQPPAAAPEAPDDINEIDDAISNLLEDQAAMATLIPVPPQTVQTPPRPVTPAPIDPSTLLTPVLKQEPMEVTPEKNDEVICLDSDDEDSKQGIINLSDDDAAAKRNAPTLVDLLTKRTDIHKCGKCNLVAKTSVGFRKHVYSCFKPGDELRCVHCEFKANKVATYLNHYNEAHTSSPTRYSCSLCSHVETTMYLIKKHVKTHKVNKLVVTSNVGEDGVLNYFVGGNVETPVKAKAIKRKSSGSASATPAKLKRYGPSDVDKLPINPILDESVYCDVCEFNTKVRLNMVRHLQLHAEQQPAPQTAPVNPVPHLETNEKHFDKMVNLASSSITTRAAEKGSKEPTPTIAVSSDLASRFPKYVPERYRYTCGATGCTYISVDEAMLRCHWETLHSGTNDYHCVHCPPYQHLDKSQPLTAIRILSHLKMHDIRLYACSACPYYHHKRHLVDKHMVETHKGGSVLVVREESVQPAPTTTAAAPTMDLKPWQCGLCNFKNMLRQEVVEHCAKFHQSKMQYKCAYCPFRTSTPENVTKHQTTSHPNREHEIFYFYYREGSIPNGPDGTPHWQKQRQKTGVDSVKAESDPIPTSGTILPQIQPQSTTVAVNLNLIKQEIDPDAQATLEPLADLCQKFGDFCEPNGLNYKCSLCKVVVEDSKEAMQSHLFEELQYRKWGCRLCSYKAFHQPGLKDHMWTEHRQNQEAIELPVDINVEYWVSKQLEYQEDLIKKNREKLAQQKMQDERTVAPSTSKTVEPQTSVTSKLTMQELEQYFGPLGVPSNMQFTCPKCQYKTKDEVLMQNHLESFELARIRWCCSNCSTNFSTYHEAQFHCKSVHTGQMSRPVEAARDPAIRAAWVAAVIRVQKLSMNCMPVTLPEPQRIEENESNEDGNSLLVIRYEEDVPTPEEETLRRQRADSDDENLIIDETPKKSGSAKCSHCDFTSKYVSVIESHVLRHYNLKPYNCPHCAFNNYRAVVVQHMETMHPDLPKVPKKTEKPSGPPTILSLPKPGSKKVVPVKKVTIETLVCLICEKLLTEIDARTHVHENDAPRFAKRGDLVVKCSECLMLFLDIPEMQQHFTSSHPGLIINYAYYKTEHDSRGFIFCGHCNQRFSYLIDLKAHHNLVHSTLKLKYTSKPYTPDSTSAETSNKRKSDEPTLAPKRT